jgi:threonine dehydratase
MIARSAIAGLAALVRHTCVEIDAKSLPHHCSDKLKPEISHHTGSFRPRGAFNRLLNATMSEAGVITASGGNYGAAIAPTRGRFKPA